MDLYFKTLFDDYEFITDHSIHYDERLEFSASGLVITLTLHDPHFRTAQKCIASAAKTFMDENKNDFVFFEPTLCINPLECSVVAMLPIIYKGKYENIMREREKEVGR